MHIYARRKNDRKYQYCFGLWDSLMGFPSLVLCSSLLSPSDFISLFLLFFFLFPIIWKEKEARRLMYLCSIYCSPCDRIFVCCIWIFDELYPFFLLLIWSLLNFRIVVPYLENHNAPSYIARLKRKKRKKHSTLWATESTFFFFFLISFFLD